MGTTGDSSLLERLHRLLLGLLRLGLRRDGVPRVLLLLLALILIFNAATSSSRALVACATQKSRQLH